MKEAVKDKPADPPREIYDSVSQRRTEELGEERSTAKTIPTEAQSRSMMKRMKSLHRPNLPSKIQDITVPDGLKYIVPDMQFVYQEGEIVMFLDPRMVPIIQGMKPITFPNNNS